MRSRPRFVLSSMRWVLVLLTLASCAPPSTAPAEAAPVAVARAVELGPPRAPSPITGGTLAVTDDGALALAAEPDRDTVWLVSLRGALEVVGQVRLRPGDQPTRIALDSTGLAHVTLRGAAAVASFDPRHPERALRRSVCPAPTGIAVDEATLHVACAGGELVTLRPGAGSTTRRLRGDLRDVGVDAAGLWVSRFRSAELVRVSDLGAVSRAVPERLGPVADRDRLTFSARVAWRTIPDAERGHWMLHQWHLADPMPVADLEAQRRYYGDGVVKVGLTRFADGQAEPGHVFDALSMAVDAVALDPDRIAVAAAGRREVAVLYPATGRHNGFPSSVHGGGTPVAVAHHPDVGIVVQYRDPARLGIFEDREPTELGERSVALGAATEPDPGHELFHESTVRGVACASCHPEGADDGHVWRLGEMARRTQTLTGGVSDTAPFHWAGDVESFDHLMSVVFVERMGGEAPSDTQVRALEAWIDSIEDPTPPGVPDLAAARRGRALFADPVVGCADCHRGARGTDGRSHDVGTGGAFQTPPLVGLAQRAPLFHDGCADSIEERFTQCHTPGHGRVEHLDARAVADLVAYLRAR